jgi:hypothetical protein
MSRTALVTTIAALGIFGFICVPAALADNCPVEKFTIQDLERLKFSEALAISVVDTMDSSHYSDSDKSFNAGILIKGVPINVNYKDMKTISDYVKKNSSLNFSRNQQLDFLRTNLSIVGAAMYKDCLKYYSQNFSVDIPDNAYTDADFAVRLRWTPKYSLADRKDPAADATVQVVNGTVDGSNVPITKKIIDQKTATFVVSRADKTKSLEIIPTVDGYDNGENSIIVIPPIITPTYSTVLRTWPGPGDQPFTPMCSDDGGGHCGSDPHTRVECIYASNNGVLLPSTAEAHPVIISNAIVELQTTNDYTKVCYRFGTNGVSLFGKHGYSGLSAFHFTAREVVPSP